MSKKDRSITVLTDCSLITCVVERGLGDVIVKAARDAGAQGATVNFARGSGVRDRLGLLGVAVEIEKEIIQIVVSNDQVNRIFEHMYLAANLDTPGKGIMYVTPLEKAATYIPEEVLLRIRKRSRDHDDADQGANP